jgi:hypothetical protein
MRPFSFLVIMSAAFCCLPMNLPAQSKGKEKMKPAWLEETLKLWAEKDAAAAFAHLEVGTPEQIGERYSELANDCYNDRKDVAAMILASRAGIDFCLRHARELATTDEPSATKLRGRAKMISYNLGANLWPGWKDPVVLSANDRAIGLDAARLNLRLGQELGRPAEPLGHAHWLLGAQLLAANKHSDAAKEFAASAARFKEAKKPTEEQMAVAYEKLANRLGDPKNAALEASLQTELKKLTDLSNDDAKFFAEQIRTAEEVFLAK